MPSTPKYALPYPASSAPNNVPADISALATAVENAMATASTGTAAARPAATKFGRWWLTSDTGVLSFDTGTTWLDVYGTFPPMVIASRTGSAQAIAASASPGYAWTQVTGMGANTSSGGIFDATTQRISAPVGRAGWWEVNQIISWDEQFGTSVVPAAGVAVRKNGTTVYPVDQQAMSGAFAGVFAIMGGPRILNLAANDYLELLVRQTDSVSHNVRVQEWSARWIRP